MGNVTKYEVNGPIATIRFNRPEKLNAINPEVIAEVLESLDAAKNDDTVKVLILAGSDRAFSAGHDITEEVEEKTETALQWQKTLDRDVDFTMRIWEFPKPTIAAVSGYCLAGGCEVAMACDMILATEGALFGEPEIQYGSGPATLLMPFVLGQKKTNELLFTGDKISAQQALEAGLINRVVPDGEVDSAAVELALRIAPTPLEILRLTKLSLVRAYEAKGLRSAVNQNIVISSMLNSAATPEQEKFDEIAAEKGLKAALAWRDARYATGQGSAR